MTFADFFASLSDLLSTDRALYVPWGLQVARTMAVILIAVYGIRVIFLGWDGRQGLKLLWTYLLVIFTLTYWDQPIPWAGVTASSIIPNTSKVLADVALNNADDVIYRALDQMENAVSVNSPFVSLWKPEAIFIWVMFELIIWISEAALWLVISFGYIAEALLVMAGPLAIGATLIPGVEWLGYGWLRSSVQFGLYPIIAGLYTNLVSRFLTLFLARHPPGQWSTVDLSLLAGPVILLATAMVTGVVLVPSLVSSMSSGRSGESAIPRFLRVRF